MIKKILFMAIITVWMAGCASTKNASRSYLGDWEYIVKNTPEGDFTGILTLSKDGDNYTGALKSADNQTPLQNVVIDGNNLSCTFDYMGYNIILKGIFEGEILNGNMTVEYNDFPFTAHKVKK
jgi:hypothetical protein